MLHFSCQYYKIIIIIIIYYLKNRGLIGNLQTLNFVLS